jgi:hypothetical protein
MSAKPTVQELGIDVDAQAWQRSGEGAGSIEIAFVGFRRPARGDGEARGTRPSGLTAGGAVASEAGEWVLMRMADDPAQRVLVYDRNEWECFLDGVRNGEFDSAEE